MIQGRLGRLNRESLMKSIGNNAWSSRFIQCIKSYSGFHGTPDGKTEKHEYKEGQVFERKDVYYRPGHWDTYYK